MRRRPSIQAKGKSILSAARRSGAPWAVMAALCLSTNPAGAVEFFSNKDQARVTSFCEVERAPLVERDKDYEELKKSRFAKALGEGLKQGATVLVIGVVSVLTGNSGSSGSKSKGSAWSDENRAAARSMRVPGVNNGGGKKQSTQEEELQAWAAMAVLVAIVGTIESYVRLKQEQAGGDMRVAAGLIEQDAAGQLGVGRSTAAETAALADCRQRQKADIDSRIASATNDKDRKALKRENTLLVGALKQDIDVTGDIIKEQTGMAKTFTQGRAMAEGVSEAQVLGGQKPAYAATASTAALKMPEAPQPLSGGGAPELVTLRSTVVRTTPTATGGVVMTFAAGREVKPKRRSVADSSWWEIDIGGVPGYIRGADLGEPGAAPAKPAPKGGKGGKGGKGAKGPPPLAAPTNIRAYNQSIIAARDGGGSRLNTLMTDIQG